MGYLKQFMNAWREEASTTRIFFPDNGELAIARSGQASDPAAGRASLDPIFTDARWQYGECCTTPAGVGQRGEINPMGAPAHPPLLPHSCTHPSLPH